MTDIDSCHEMEDNMITVNKYVEIPHKVKSIGIGVGVIDGTNNLYIERFKKNNGENETIKSITCFGVAEKVFERGGQTIMEDYISALKYGYKNNIKVRRGLEPIVYGFTCITGTQMKSIEL